MAHAQTVEEIRFLIIKAKEELEAGALDDCVKTCNDVLNDEPSSGPALFILATALLKADKHGLAYNLLKRNLELVPNREEIYNNLGMAAIGCNEYDEARKLFEKAIKIGQKQGGHALASYNNLALCYLNDCKPEEAVYWAEKSLAVDPNQKDVKETLGYAQLMLGDYENGFRNSENALGGKYRKWKTYRGEPYWNGEKVNTLVVRGEQGLGDEICFASVLNDAQKDMNIVLECDHRLEGLFKRSFDFPVYPTRHVRDPITWPLDYQIDASCLSGSLLPHYRKKREDFPGEPYLRADPERRIQWRALLDSLGPKPKIGIAWKGGARHSFRHRRSLRLVELLPILRQHAEFVCLEYGDAAKEIEELNKSHGINIHYWPRAVKKGVDADETAALLSELDLVITVQNATVHLCGALGVPAWVVVPNKPRWFYGMQGQDLPWYKSIRIYRQVKGWDGVINKIAQDLRDYFQDRRGDAHPPELHGGEVSGAQKCQDRAKPEMPVPLRILRPEDAGGAAEAGYELRPLSANYPRDAAGGG